MNDKENKYKVLKDLVKINTIKDKGNKEIIDYLENYLLNLGFKTEYKDKALIMSIGDNPKVGFLGHTDTVDYAKDKWTKNPFDLKLEDGKIYGLGVCDMKGGIAAMLDAITQIKNEKKKLNMKVYFTYAEETTFEGMKDILEYEKNFPETMIFGEPTNNEILVGSKGILELEFKFIGKSAHSSTPDKGISANMNAIKIINNLYNFYLKEIKPDINNNFEINYTTMNIGTIHGGTNKNSVAEECVVTIDFRTVKEEHTKKILKELEEIKKEIEIEQETKENKKEKQIKIELKITENINPFINEISNIEIKTANFITEASLLINQNKTEQEKNKKDKEKLNKTINKLIIGPGPITAHEVDEYITEESYEELINQYKKICILKN